MIFGMHFYVTLPNAERKVWCSFCTFGFIFTYNTKVTELKSYKFRNQDHIKVLALVIGIVYLTDSSRGLKCKTFCKMCSCKKSAKNLQKFCRFFCKFFAILLQFFCNCFANFLQNWFGIRIKGSHFRVNILLRGTTNPKIRGRTLTQVLHQNTQDFPISISQTPSVLMNVTKKVVPYILH